jgi:hypothetical protein
MKDEIKASLLRPCFDGTIAYMAGFNILHVTTNEHQHIFDDLIELLTDALGQLGHSVERATAHLDRSRINLLIGHTAFLEKEAYDSIRQSRAKFIIFQMETLTERPGIPRPSENYLQILNQAAQVWDYSKNNLEFLRARGCQRVQYIPLGYSARLQRIVQGKNKDIDVLFYGAGNARRVKIIDSLRARGLQVEAIFRAYGQIRDEAICRSKIVLNLHKFDHSELEQVRISFLLNNQSFVISESAEGNPWGDGVVFADYNLLAECCQEYAQPTLDARRNEIATAGLNALKSLSMAQSLQQAIERI